MSPFNSSWGSPVLGGLFFGFAGVLLALLLIWSIAWKGLALWKSAREGSKIWFIVFLVVNTAGILEILYTYVFSKKPGMPSSTHHA